MVTMVDIVSIATMVTVVDMVTMIVMIADGDSDTDGTMGKGGSKYNVIIYVIIRARILFL